MADLKKTARDMEIVNGDVRLTAGVEAHAQRAEMHYETFLGESAYDQSAGFPWIQIVLGSRLPLEVVRMLLDLYGRQIPGIVSTSIVAQFNKDTRKSTFTGTIETIDGDVDFSIAPLSDEETT